MCPTSQPRGCLGEWQPPVVRAFRQVREGRGQEADSAGGVRTPAAAAGGVATLAWPATCQWSGKRSPRCPVGIVGKRVSTSRRYAHGSTPRRWHVDVRLNSTAAVWPPRGDPTVNQFL